MLAEPGLRRPPGMLLDLMPAIPAIPQTSCISIPTAFYRHEGRDRDARPPTLPNRIDERSVVFSRRVQEEHPHGRTPSNGSPVCLDVAERCGGI